MKVYLAINDGGYGLRSVIGIEATPYAAAERHGVPLARFRDTQVGRNLGPGQTPEYLSVRHYSAGYYADDQYIVEVELGQDIQDYF